MRTPPSPPRSDRELGIHTHRAVQLAGLDIRSENRVHGNRYEPTPFGVLDDMLCGLCLEYPRYDFVDLGSGKGRVLALAATYPFRAVRGVEFSTELHLVAVTNLEQLDVRHRRCRDVRSVHTDAATYTFPARPLVLFMFNPFTAPVLARVLTNLESTHGAGELTAYVLYYMPVHQALLERARWLQPHSASRDWVVYEARSAVP